MKNIFLWDYNICRNNWRAYVKCIMNKIGLSQCFEHLEVCDINNGNQLLYDMCTRDWSHKIQTVSKLRTYRTFKTSYNVEKYVLMNLNRRERSILAQFRIGILPLPVGTGRYIGENPEQRLSKICPGGQIEDETHFLFSCDLYNDANSYLFRFHRNIYSQHYQ